LPKRRRDDDVVLALRAGDENDEVSELEMLQIRISQLEAVDDNRLFRIAQLERVVNQLVEVTSRLDSVEDRRAAVMSAVKPVATVTCD